MRVYALCFSVSLTEFYDLQTMLIGVIVVCLSLRVSLVSLSRLCIYLLDCTVRDGP